MIIKCLIITTECALSKNGNSSLIAAGEMNDCFLNAYVISRPEYPIYFIQLLLNAAITVSSQLALQCLLAAVNTWKVVGLIEPSIIGAIY